MSLEETVLVNIVGKNRIGLVLGMWFLFPYVILFKLLALKYLKRKSCGNTVGPMGWSPSRSVPQPLTFHLITHSQKVSSYIWFKGIHLPTHACHFRLPVWKRSLAESTEFSPVCFRPKKSFCIARGHNHLKASGWERRKGPPTCTHLEHVLSQATCQWGAPSSKGN